ncbi:AMP-binding protein [Streptomyces sp. NPDC091040]|uniref:AMP-binding protein n=1 Tax=Streptomyces sp. NPDC091040 TaxID=3365972 RepID=UPI0037F8C4B6
MMLYQRFEATAARYGTRTALELDGESYSYRRLAEMAESLAAHIHARSEGAHGRIGLMTGRSLLGFVGYLAVQRLGMSVVPLNASFPQERTRHMLAASGARLVVAEPGLTVPDVAGVRVLAVDPTSVPRTPAPVPPLAVAPEAEAYLLFTSGSTGAPKGVPIRQRHLSAFLDTVRDRFGLGPESRCSQFFDLTFDPSVFDLFAVWSAGATLVVPSRNDLLRPVRFVTDNALTHWYAVPSAISRAQAGGRLLPGSMPSLRHSMFGGEALTWQQARAWRDAAPSSILTNAYGPTEVTIFCSDVTLPADPGDWPATPNGVVPIGLPYPGLEYAVFDESGQPATEGELCVRGPQRFDGYLDPEANRGRFHPSPPPEGDPVVPEDSWYRTGDRVTSVDGVPCFLGRVDHQVKVSGYRVEPGEIEAALLSLPGVALAVVVAVREDADALGLYAVCVAPSGDPAGLRAALVRDLPAYMVPRRVLTVDQLPCDANGKVDRRAVAELVRAALGRPVAVGAGRAVQEATASSGERSRTS